MKVVLVNPRSRNPGEIQQKCFAPANLMYLAAALEANGQEAVIIDANALGLNDREVTARIKAQNPGLIGISLLSEIIRAVYDLTRTIKQACPRVPLVLGGPHANALPEKVLQEFTDAAYVLTGECEESLVMLCRALEKRSDPDQVPGLYYRREERITGNSPGLPPRNINQLPSPDRRSLSEAYQKKRYFMILVRQRPVETLLTSRGCPFQCRFCSNIPGRFRARSPDSVLEEMVVRYQDGIRHFDVADANFTFDIGRSLAIFDGIIKEKLDIAFRFKSRTTSITPELVHKARQAGAYLVSLGLESGSQQILDRMNKKTTISGNIAACKTVREAGLKLNTGWIVGFPGETRETLAQTVDLLLKIKPTTANIGRLVPYPGTAVYEEARAEKTLMGDWTVGGGYTPWVRLPWIYSLAELEKITRKVINRVYYRPHYLWQFAGDILGNGNLPLARYALQEARKSMQKKR